MIQFPMNWGLFRPSRPTLTCFILLLLSFLAMTFQLSSLVQGLRLFLFSWIAPAYEMPVGMIHNVSGLGSRLVELVSAYQENRILKTKIKQFSFLEVQLQDALSENRTLREILELRAKQSWTTRSAQVYSRDSQSWTQSLWIDCGVEQGLKTDDPVLAVHGNPIKDAEIVSSLIGRILECGPNSSKVLLISDPLSSLAVSIVRNGEEGLLQGRGSFMITVEYLNPTADIQPGDQVVTSGLGGIFPAGLLVGTVSKVIALPSGFKRAELTPAISLSRLKEVLVLKSKV